MTFYDILIPRKTSLHQRCRLISVLRRTDSTVQYLAMNGMEPCMVTEVYPLGCYRVEGGRVITSDKEKFEAAIQHFDSCRRRHETVKVPENGTFPSLVSLVDSFEENGTLYILTSLPQGEPLLQYARRNTIRPRTMMDYLRKLLPDLIKAAELGGDLSGLHCAPDTVFIVPSTLHSFDPYPILTDFYGKPQLPDNTTAQGPRPDPYEPIEWFTSRQETDQRTVIYRLCAMCYYFLRKQDPQSAIDRLFDDQTFFFVQPDDPDAPFWAVMKKGMAVKPGDRYQTFREFYEALTCLR